MDVPELSQEIKLPGHFDDGTQHHYLPIINLYQFYIL